MNDKWWPDLLAHIPSETPWADPHVIVARIQPFPDPFFPGVRFSRTALVPVGALDAVRRNLRGLGHEVESAGPRPGPRLAGDYDPKFWIRGVDLPETQYEPLVLSWTSANLTTLQIDPGFLMTYGLSSRLIEGRQLSYDDPAAPQYDVVRQTGQSRYDGGGHELALVSVERDYLQDYLSLRGMALIEVYYEIRRGERDDTLAAELDGGNGKIIQLPDREFQIQLRPEGGFVAQVWGARVLAEPADFPVSMDPLDDVGLVWPGIEGPVDNARARGFGPQDQVYVRDAVLGAYEGKPGYDVFPESGAVSFGAQWGVHWCRRVGRDLIALEIKKIYEAATPRAIRHWHSYAVAPPAKLDDPALAATPNAGSRARRAISALAGLGERLAGTAALHGLANAELDDFTRVDRRALAGNDWWRLDSNAAIARHIPLDLSEQAFLDRCVALANVVLEGLGERSLRRLAEAFGVDTGKIRSLLLLNWIVRLAETSVDTGVRLQDPVLLEILKGREETRPLNRLFALNDLRQLGAHNPTDRRDRLAAALARFDLAPGAVASGYGGALDQIYDRVTDDLETVATLLGRAHQV